MQDHQEKQRRERHSKAAGNCEEQSKWQAKQAASGRYRPAGIRPAAPPFWIVQRLIRQLARTVIDFRKRCFGWFMPR
jgi:hypothetical protein